jgi:hypothetical protein
MIAPAAFIEWAASVVRAGHWLVANSAVTAACPTPGDTALDPRLRAPRNAKRRVVRTRLAEASTGRGGGRATVVGDLVPLEDEGGITDFDSVTVTQRAGDPSGAVHAGCGGTHVNEEPLVILSDPTNLSSPGRCARYADVLGVLTA